jgi:thiosulfate reductase cytochrome b subunit
MPTNSPNAPQSNEPQVQLYAKHTWLTRTLHWLNAVAIGSLIATGIAMMIGGDWLKSLGGSIHEVFYFLLFGIGGVYLISLIASGRWKMFLPTRAVLGDASAVVKSELGTGVHSPRLKKYNGAQRLAYGAVILMVAGEVVTGVAMAFHDQLPWLPPLLGGRRAAHSIHKLLMFGIVGFAIVHVVQVIRAGWPSLRSMLSGYAVVPVGDTHGIDGAIPEPGLLSAPMAVSAARKTLDARTAKGFVGAAVAGAMGLILLAVGSVRDAGAEGTGDRHGARGRHHVATRSEDRRAQSERAEDGTAASPARRPGAGGDALPSGTGGGEAAGDGDGDD